MILLSDANVLIHLAAVGGLWVLPHLEATEVLDAVLSECSHPSHPGLIEEVRAAGIRIVESQVGWLLGSMELGTAKISAIDALVLYYSRMNKRIVLTNDKPMRQACARLELEARGTIWIINECANKALVEPAELIRWIDILSDPKYRLPLDELRRQRNRLEEKC